MVILPVSWLKLILVVIVSIQWSEKKFFDDGITPSSVVIVAMIFISVWSTNEDSVTEATNLSVPLFLISESCSTSLLCLKFMLRLYNDIFWLQNTPRRNRIYNYPVGRHWCHPDNLVRIYGFGKSQFSCVSPILNIFFYWNVFSCANELINK